VRTRSCGLLAALVTVAATLGTAPAALADSTAVVPAGVSVGGIDVSGLTRDAADARVRSAFFGTALKVDVDGVAFAPGAWRFGLQADVGGWELARLQLHADGTRQVVLRRRARLSYLPGPVT